MWDILAGGDFVQAVAPTPVIVLGKKLPRRRPALRDRRPVAKRCRGTPHEVWVQPGQLALPDLTVGFPSLLLH